MHRFAFEAKAKESRTHILIVGECEMQKEGRDALEYEMRKRDECVMEKLSPPNNSEKAITILGDRRRWPQRRNRKRIT